jgi:hypothetical protein
MNKLFPLLMISLLIHYKVNAQPIDIIWSPFGDKEKQEVIKVADKFMRTYVRSEFQNMQIYFSNDEVNYGGEVWLKTPQFISMIQTIRGKNDIEIGEIQAFTMDDTEKNPEIKAKSLKIFRVFSNCSIFVTVDLTDKTKDTNNTIFLNIIFDNDKNWVVNSFTDTSIKFSTTTKFPQERFRIESYHELKFDIPIPVDFSTGTKTRTQTSYILSGETDRDATIQIDWNELIAPVSILSYNWVQYIVNQYNYSDILIKYLPYGYTYEYFVKDQDGISNKGITTAFESNNKFVFIQYFSFTKTYDRIENDIDIMLRNINFYE